MSTYGDDAKLLREHVNLLRQQNATLNDIAKHTRLQYVLTCVALLLLLLGVAIGLLVAAWSAASSDASGWHAALRPLAVVAVLGAVLVPIALLGNGWAERARSSGQASAVSRRPGEETARLDAPPGVLGAAADEEHCSSCGLPYKVAWQTECAASDKPHRLHRWVRN